MAVEVEAAVESVNRAFAEYKATNDARLSEIEKKGSADVLRDEKLARIDQSLQAFEALNQKVTALELEGRKAKSALDAVEVKLGRIPGKPAAGRDPVELKARVNAWARGVVRANIVGLHNLDEIERKAIIEAQQENKSLALTPDTAAGYLAPVEYVREIIKAVTEVTPFRSAVRIRQTANKSIQIPKRTGQFAAVRTAEQGTRSETTGLTFGLEEISVPEMYALVDVSQQMLEDSAFDLESEIRMEAQEQFSVKEGAEFVSGTGVNQLEGILSNSSVATVNSGSGSTLTGDGIISLFYGIKSAYARNGVFMLARSTISVVRKLKDGQNNYLWQPGFAANVPNTILGAPYVEAPDMPAVAGSAKPLAFGDFQRGYTLVDRIAMEMLRDPYTQATSGNVRFIFRRRVGGQVTLAEAFATQTVST